MQAEYRFTDIVKPIGISIYELTRAIPPALKSTLTTVEQLELELAETESLTPPAKPLRKKLGDRK